MKRISLVLGICMLSFLTISTNAQDTRLLKAEKYFELYAFDQAIEHYLEYLKSDDDHTLAITRLADCYRLTGNSEKAIHWYSKATYRSDRDPVAILNYAHVLKSSGKFRQAKTLYLEFSRQRVDKRYQELGRHYAASCDFAMANESGITPYTVHSEAINSSYSDFAPAFYEDLVIFSSFRSDPVNGTAYIDDINQHSFNLLYRSDYRGKEGLSNEQILKKEYKSESNQCHVNFSPSNKMVAFVRNNYNFTDGVLPLSETGAKLDIFISEFGDETNWMEKSSFIYNGAKYSTGWPCISADGEFMYFASDAPGGYGGFDLYVCKRSGDKWSEPKNLGSQVNSPGNEISPFEVEGSLYFSSDWHHGFGGMDVFRSEKVADIWTRVTNMGYGINSPKNDFDYVYDTNNNVAFFASNREGGIGNDDIYRATWPSSKNIAGIPIESKPKPASNLEEELILGKTEAVADETPEATIETNANEIDVSSDGSFKFFEGRLVNSADNKPIGAVDVRARDTNSGTTLQTISNEQGVYELPLEAGVEYMIIFSKEGMLNTAKLVKVEDVAKMDFLGVTSIDPSPEFTDVAMANTGSVELNEETNEKPPAVSREEPTTSTKKTSDAAQNAQVVSSTSDRPEDAIEEVQETSSLEAAVPDPDFIAEARTSNSSEAAIAQEQTMDESTSLYEIQVGAFKNPDMDRLTKLAEVGSLYEEIREDVTVFKVGKFQSIEDAVKAKNQIQDHGFEDAFIRKLAVFEIAKGNDIVQPQSNPNSSAAHIERIITDEAVSQSSSISGQIIYKVQLGAFKHPNLDDFDKRISNWGEISLESLEGGLNRVLLGDFSTHKAAEMAKDKVAEYGVKGAFVVAYKNGQKIPMSDLAGN